MDESQNHPTANRLLALLQAIIKLIKRPFRDTGSPQTMWPFLYFIFVSLFRISFRIWGHWKIKGRDRLPASGAYIVAANHVSYIDPPVVGSALRRPAYFMAKAELFKVPFFGASIPRVGAYPVKRGSPDRAAVKRTMDLLAAGEIVSIFPEGTRRPPGELAEAEGGFGWLVYKSRATVVPMGIVNSHKLLPRNARWFQSTQLRVHIGAPLRFGDLWDAPDSRWAMKEIGRRTMAAIEELIATASP